MKENLDRIKQKANSTLRQVRTDSQSMMSEECLNSFKTEVLIL